LSISSVIAQDEDEATETLEELITAFQNCGPPQAYRVLSPNLWNIVRMQTNGLGCYQQIMAAGPIVETEVIARQDFPLGPLYIIRVYHPSVAADWFVGFNGQTSNVEYLTFQAANQNNEPTIAAGPDRAAGLSNSRQREARPSSPVRTSEPADPDEAALREACRKYPGMCPPRNAD
jgi:hypothetical protein